MPFDLVIFDCDGVLVDSEPLVNRVYVELLREIGFEIDERESLVEFCGASMAMRIAALSRRFTWSPAPDFEGRFHERLTVVMQRELRPVAGVRDVLDAVSVPVCVASNGTTDEIRLRLDLTGLLGYVADAAFSAPELGRPKPFPDVFLHAARSFGAVPERCAVIEDSVPGVQAGIAAGMTVFGYAALSDAAALRVAGATIFTRMDRLPGLLASG